MIKQLIVKTLLIVSICFYSFNSFCQKLEINPDSKHTILPYYRFSHKEKTGLVFMVATGFYNLNYIKFKRGHNGIKSDFIYRLAFEKGVGKFYTIDDHGNISEKTPIVFKQAKQLTKLEAADIKIIDNEPILFYRALDKEKSTWKSFAGKLSEDGIVDVERSTVIDERKGAEAIIYDVPQVYLNSENNKFITIATKKGDGFSLRDGDSYKTITAQLFDKDLKQLTEKKDFNIDLPGRRAYEITDMLFENGKAILVARTTAKNLIIKFPSDVDDYILTCDLLSGKIKIDSLSLNDRKVNVSVLHLKDKIVFSGAVLENKHNYLKSQYIAAYNLITGQIDVKPLEIPDEVFQKAGIKSADLLNLRYLDDLYFTDEGAVQKDDGSYFMVLGLHIIEKSFLYKLNGSAGSATEIDGRTVKFSVADFDMLTELVSTDSLLKNENIAISGVKKHLTGLIITPSKIITFSIADDKDKSHKKNLIEYEISLNGDFNENVIYSFGENDAAPHGQLGNHLNVDVMRDEVIIFEMKRNDDGYYATLDISK